MKGYWIYLAFMSLLSILAALEENVFFFILIVVTIFVLYQFKLFTKKQLLLVMSACLLLMLRGELAEKNNRTKFKGVEKEFLILFENEINYDGNLLTSNGKDLNKREKLVIRYTIKSEEEKNRLREKLITGAVCRLKGELIEPPVSTNENAFHYKNYLKQQHIHWMLKVEQFNHCKEKSSPIFLLRNIRQMGIDYMVKYFPEDTATLASALIFGDRSLMGDELLESYQKLGIVHLLAISGLHVALLMGILYYIGIRIGITRERVLNLLIILLPIYIILTGAAPSVVRACSMMIMVLIIKKFSHSIQMIDVLSIVFIMYICIFPYVIYNVGFQLSFSVTLALIISSARILKNATNPILLLIYTSIVSQVISMPILLYYFYEISIISIAANIIYIPLFSICILPSLLLLFILHVIVGDPINPLITVMNFFIKVINLVTEHFSSFPYAVITLGKPTIWLLVLYIISIPIMYIIWEKQISKKGIVKIILIQFGILLIHFFTVHIDSKGEVTFIDVGQGDSILLKLPHSQGTYLIDTGGTIQFQSEQWKKRKNPYEVGKNVLVPYLKSKGITKIDKLILTHGDMDHVGGALAVLNYITVSEVFLPKTKEPSALELRIVNLAKEKQIPIKTVKQGDRWTINRMDFNILSPSNSCGERNDCSIVVHANVGGINWLFTGDLEEEGERKLVQSYPKLKVDVLKVGHHGSKSSTSELLLRQYQPKASIISVGKENRFGHPHPDVLNRLKEHKIIIFRTDQDGAITYQFKGNRGTFLKRFP
ncbi:DNA internalization-related competence protein ComEC/Rec2 (plasmid) [Bacillus sp. 31A1R]|uniref:DNA internalization-related competence protein ComEC/Rec2 n=1 Tax=Robertmurraya mangrovi TaxID=3098077 RepID=A0ABU5IUW1_9BACI|nr:DNA internalization-related competence protein ComEC/Rec2 [Bacillus sp. 31A1R]MDZ5470918.1 DNA internalization-related competence protein ComEC/Rec2 [Bacillus sp. 31A1R]